MALLIDGHNLIGQMQDLSLADPDDEAKLIKQLRTFGLLARKQITVIFDPSPHDTTTRLYNDIQHYDSVKVIYAMPGQKADDLIRNLVGKVRDKQGTLVITSDNAVAKFTRVCGVKVLSSPDFIKQMKSQLAERIFTDAKPSPTRKENKEWAEVFKEPPPTLPNGCTTASGATSKIDNNAGSDRSTGNHLLIAEANRFRAATDSVRPSVVINQSVELSGPV